MSLFQPNRGNAGSTADSYQSPPGATHPLERRRYGGLITAVGLIVFSSVISGASSSLITDRHVNFAFFPLNTPGIVAIPVAFFLGWLGTVTDRRPADSARFARMQVRALTGVGAERGGHA
jgi:hypothetical protein